ncbi:50S ribosomal protein L30 [termite gut metagenome]|uniref:50S ribosomal protein L30 n=1 Tax=termite gut metagenome TaxID=433724 RepID=A0A5J4R8D8_9ZZZZ
MSTIQIKQVRSRIGCPKDQKRTLDALGLRKTNRVVEHENNPSILGMVEKVKHLVSVTENPILTKKSKNTDLLKIKTTLSIDNFKEQTVDTSIHTVIGSMGMTKEDGIKQVYSGGGHVVILGAGASIASSKRNPGKKRIELPSMNNFIKVLVTVRKFHLNSINENSDHR